MFFFEDLGVGNFNSFSGDAVGFICIWSSVLFVAMADVVAVAVVGKLSAVAFVDGLGAFNLQGGGGKYRASS